MCRMHWFLLGNHYHLASHIIHRKNDPVVHHTIYNLKLTDTRLAYLYDVLITVNCILYLIL